MNNKDAINEQKIPITLLYFILINQTIPIVTYCKTAKIVLKIVEFNQVYHINKIKQLF